MTGPVPAGSAWYQARSARKESVRRCRLLAERLYGKPDVLSHERVAGDLAEFLGARFEGNDALLSVVEFEVDTATYLSCGERAIKHALAVLLRLATAFDDHPDYHEEWRP